jgi:hypothetical protein
LGGRVMEGLEKGLKEEPCEGCRGGRCPRRGASRSGRRRDRCRRGGPGMRCGLAHGCRDSRRGQCRGRRHAHSAAREAGLARGPAGCSCPDGSGASGS